MADAFGRLVNSGSLDSLVRDDRTVVQKILDAVRDMLNAIRRAVSGKGASLTEAQRSEFRDLEGRVAGMERLLQDALERSADLQGNEKVNTRFSLKSTDSQGRELTPEQQEFFKDSAIRIDEWGDYGTDDGLADEIAYRTGDGTPSERGEEFRDWLQSLGYDGIIVQDREFGGTSFVAFDPEQIKRTTNRTPTSNPDIRFSRSNREQLEDYAALQRENELLRERVDYWRGQTRRTVSGAVDRKQVDRAARELIDAYGSELDADGISGDLYALHAKPATRYKGADKTFADTYATTVGQDPR